MTRTRQILDWLTTRLLPLLWYGRLSWMRIALALSFGRNLYGEVVGWQTPTPRYPSNGWLLGLIPDDVEAWIFGNSQAVSILVVVLTGLAIVGLGTRAALLLLSLIGLFAFSWLSSEGLFHHEWSLTTQVLFVLAFAPGTNAVSLERLIGWWRAGRPDLLGYLSRPYRKWGQYLILGLLAVTYTAAGLSKLRFSGWKWLDGSTLGFYLGSLSGGNRVFVIGGGPTTWRDDFGLENYTYANWGYYQRNFLETGLAEWIIRTPGVLVVLSIATIILELAGILLFIPRLRSILLIGYIGMHMTIGVLMGLAFTDYQIVCFFLIEWELLGAFLLWLRRRRDARAAAASDADAAPPASIAEADPLSRR